MVKSTIILAIIVSLVAVSRLGYAMRIIELVLVNDRAILTDFYGHNENAVHDFNRELVGVLNQIYNQVKDCLLMYIYIKIIFFQVNFNIVLKKSIVWQSDSISYPPEFNKLLESFTDYAKSHYY